jgi:hypothetical protein
LLAAFGLPFPLDHLVGKGEQFGRDFEAKGLRSLQVNDQFKRRRLQHWEITRACRGAKFVQRKHRLYEASRRAIGDRMPELLGDDLRTWPAAYAVWPV